MRAEVGIIVTQVRCKAVDTDIFRAVGPSDCYKLPLFGMHYERFFEGALQIKPILVRDVNRIMGTHYTHAQVTNRATAVFIANAYLSHYGKNLSDESLARLWQGGPKGLRRSFTRAYGKRVMRKLDALENSAREQTENHHLTKK